MGLHLLLFHVLNLNAHGITLEVVSKLHQIAVRPFNLRIHIKYIGIGGDRLEQKP